MKKPDLTIIIPWLSRSDWTGLILDSLIFEAQVKKINYNIVIGDNLSVKKKAPVKGPFSFLYPKLKVVEKIISLSHQNLLADRLVVVDSSFINMKALRYIAGDHRFIACFVNGGYFQKHDLDRQSLDSYSAELLKFENAHYALMDKIFLPSKYALESFLKEYPDLRKKCSHHYYFLPDNFFDAIHFSKKSGYLFASRSSFEKGIDVIEKLIKGGLKIDSIIGKENRVFRKNLIKYKGVLIPSRADLFGFCALEAIVAGVIPVVPRGLSYNELVDLPDEFKISLPIGAKTDSEIKTIMQRIDNLPEKEYQRIVLRAKKSLAKKMRDSKHNFTAAAKKIFYGKK